VDTPDPASWWHWRGSKLRRLFPVGRGERSLPYWQLADGASAGVKGREATAEGRLPLTPARTVGTNEVLAGSGGVHDWPLLGVHRGPR